MYKTISSNCLMFVMLTGSAYAVELRGSVGVEARYFNVPEDYQVSASIEPDWYWEQNTSSLTFKPFARIDEQDKERTHLDVREAFYQYADDGWEFRLGLNKIFWGVTESQHLVDVVNQTDYLEGFDGEDKLGQPMVQLTRISDWGVIDLFALPYFRERKFPGPNGHFNFSPELPTPAGNKKFSATFADALYESSAEEQHFDVALRYSHTIGDWDLGVSYFSGTRRDPILQMTGLDAIQDQIFLTPFYLQMNQLGLDLQATMGAWLWKLEAISRNQTIEDYIAATAGFEYTFYGITNAGSDLGLLLEFNWDERQDQATTPMQQDLFLGGRYVLNDEQSSELLFGIVKDLEYQDSYLGRLEASRRLGNTLKISAEAWIFSSNKNIDPLYSIRSEDFIQLSLEKFF